MTLTKRLLCVAALAVSGAAQAQHFVEYGINLSLGNDYYEEYRQGETGSGAIQNELNQSGYGRVAGMANVGFGVNRARVDLTGTNADNPLNFEYGFATSRYWDTFTFEDPLLNGTEGSFEATLFVHGSGFFDTNGGLATSPSTEVDAFWHAVINVSVDGITDPFGSPIQSAYYAGEWYKGIGETSVEYFGDELNTYQTFHTFRFIYGEPIFMDSFLQTDISVDNQLENVAGTFDASIDLGNTSYWGGIRNLRDANGQIVTGAGYRSSSGFDYRASAVPEPATLVALGIGALLLCRRRRVA